MTTYYKLIECTDPSYEAGEVVARCETASRKQALRKFRMDENSLCECVAESRLSRNVYDPRLLVAANVGVRPYVRQFQK